MLLKEYYQRDTVLSKVILNSDVLLMKYTVSRKTEELNRWLKRLLGKERLSKACKYMVVNKDPAAVHRKEKL